MELMVSVAIMGILGAVAAINIVWQVPYYRMTATRTALISALRQARQQAVSQTAMATCTYNPATKCVVVWLDVNGNGQLDSGEQSSTALPAYEGMTISAQPATGTFTPLGTYVCENGGAIITLTLDPVGSRSVYVTSSGEVNSEE